MNSIRNRIIISSVVIVTLVGSIFMGIFAEKFHTPTALSSAAVATATSQSVDMTQLFQNFHIALPPAITATNAFLFTPNGSGPQYAYNANQEVAMASTTKVMTALVAIYDFPGSLDTPITVSNDVSLLPLDASRMGCLPGQVYTLRQLLYGMMLPSGDDAAVAIADGLMGSQAAYVRLMNRFAAALGLSHTSYSNTTGLDASNHYTTAEDLAHLTAFAMSFPLFQSIVGTEFYYIPATGSHPSLMLQSLNKFLDSTTPFGKANATLDVIGGKTGFTGNAGYCFTSAAMHNGLEYIVVVLGEPVYDARFQDTEALLQWAYSS